MPSAKRQARYCDAGKRLSRKRSLAYAWLWLMLSGLLLAGAPAAQTKSRPAQQQKLHTRRVASQPRPAAVVTPAEDAFLADLSRRAFLYFWEQTDAKTGLTLDRAGTDGTPHTPPHPSAKIASLGATGFGLSGLCAAAERKWVTPTQARARARRTLRFFAYQAPQEHGWYYHWMEQKTGARRWNSELSSIDTALFLGGVLSVRQCFADEAEIVRLATFIWERVDFRWMLNGHPTLLAHGWKPASGFLESRWNTYSEGILLYILAIAAPTKGIPPASWQAWRRDWVEYGGYRYLAGDTPLFIHQYPQAWVDFRGWRERSSGIDFYENSAQATRAQRRFCLSLAQEFPTYNENIWGLTASDSARGYVAWGGPPRHPATDGTVVPCAAGGSLMLTPDIALAALRAMKAQYGATIYGRYGFTDAFNPHNGWVNGDVIGIDVGITLLSAENLRSGKGWWRFMKNPEIPRALRRIGLTPN